MTLNFEGVFLSAPTPTMVLSRDLVFVAANQSYLDLFNLTQKDVVGRYVFDVFPEAVDRVQSMKDVFERTFHESKTTISEIPFRVQVNGVSKEQWWTATQVALNDSETGQSFLVQYTENVTDSVKMRQMREATMAELQHRIGNMFTIVSAIARQTGRVAKDVQDFLDLFDERLTSFIKVSKVLSGQHGQSDMLGDVIHHQMAVHGAHALDRISIAGPDVPLSMMQSQAVSMALHELATNAIKYGALSSPDGAIEISWTALSEEACRIIWRETRLSRVSDGGRSGYGTMLLTTILPKQLDGVAQRSLQDDSLVYTLEIGTA